MALLKKVLSILRWFGVMLVSLLGFLTAPIVFPLAYLLKDIGIFRNKLLWYYYDDEDGLYGTEWFREASNLKEGTFKCAYLWSAIRNPAWNLQASLKPIQDLKTYVSSHGYHSKDGNFDISVFEMCVLKYVNKLGEYKDNKGDYLSLKYSIIGSMFVWYKVQNRLYWRYSFAKNIIGKFWIELQIGTNEKRYTFRFKIKRVKVF